MQAAGENSSDDDDIAEEIIIKDPPLIHLDSDSISNSSSVDLASPKSTFHGIFGDSKDGFIKTFIADSGATGTILMEKPFPSLQDIPLPNTSLVFADGSSKKALNSVHLPNIGDAIIAHNMTENILSLPQLCDNGFQIVMTKSRIYVLHPSHDAVEVSSDKISTMFYRAEDGLYRAPLSLFLDDLGISDPSSSMNVSSSSSSSSSLN